METFFILLVFAGIPIAVFAFIIIGAVHRAKQREALSQAAQKYLKS